MFFFQEGLFRVRWTDIILDEWTRNLVKNRPEKRDSIQNQEAKMRETFPGALVTGFEQHIADLELPDPGMIAMYWQQLSNVVLNT